MEPPEYSSNGGDSAADGGLLPGGERHALRRADVGGRSRVNVDDREALAPLDEQPVPIQ
jgi:hypothetical protein